MKKLIAINMLLAMTLLAGVNAHIQPPANGVEFGMSYRSNTTFILTLLQAPPHPNAVLHVTIMDWETLEIVSEEYLLSAPGQSIQTLTPLWAGALLHVRWEDKHGHALTDWVEIWQDSIQLS